MKSKKNANTNFRFNIVTVIIYIIGIILLIQLFNLQIVHGDEYRETSNTRLTRDATTKAARGSILDRTGNKIATTNLGFSLELYKTKLDNNELNDKILKMIQVLEENGDEYTDTFPINLNFESDQKFSFDFSDEEKLKKWEQSNDIPEDATPEQAFYIFKDKYEIANEDVQEVRKIINIRYRISKEGYSSTKSIKIADNISRNSVTKFKEKNSEFPGINISVSAIRNYPMENFATHILGYVGKISDEEYEENKNNGYDMNDYFGKTGVEYVFEKYLKGKDGKRQIDMTVDGQVTEEYVTEEAKAGADIVLTIDSNLQEVAEKALETSINDLRNGATGTVYNSTYGAAVAMDVKTGEILAMASYPDYNPNLFVGGISNEDWATIRDSGALYSKATQGTSAPGSTFKMVTAIAALQEGAVTATEKINDTGIYPAAHNPVCWYYTSYHRGHGWLNITGALKNSCNYFFYEMGSRVGIDVISRYAKYFGLGVKTGVELPSENAGDLAQRSRLEDIGQSWYLGDTLSASIGQSYNSFTPIQMAKYVSMLANGGNRVNPTIIKSIIRSDGTQVDKEEINNHVKQLLGEPEQVEDIQINPENLAVVLEGMRMVAGEAGGTAYATFKDFNIEVAGKTGSAQAGNVTNGWFVGFAPYDNPEIAVAVMIEDGATGGYTGKVTREIMAEYFGMNSSNINEDITAVPYVEMSN